MTTPAKRRLVKDFKRLQKDPPTGVSAAPAAEDIMKWNGVIFGPDDTPWDGGTFKLTLEFTEVRSPAVDAGAGAPAGAAGAAGTAGAAGAAARPRSL